MKKKFLKILSLLLAVCTILPTAVACKGGNGGDGTGTSSGGDSTTPSGISNENTPLRLQARRWTVYSTPSITPAVRTEASSV